VAEKDSVHFSAISDHKSGEEERGEKAVRALNLLVTI
jgi:hypothetical protein